MDKLNLDDSDSDGDLGLASMGPPPGIPPTGLSAILANVKDDELDDEVDK